MCHNRSAATFPIFSQPSNATVSQRRKVNATVHYSVSHSHSGSFPQYTSIDATESSSRRKVKWQISYDGAHLRPAPRPPCLSLYFGISPNWSPAPQHSRSTQKCCIFFFFNFLVFSIFGFPQQQIMVGPLLAPCQLSIFHQSLDWGSFYQISPHIFHNISLAKFAF